MGLNLTEQKQAKDMILDYVQQHIGCQIQDIVAGSNGAFIEEIAGVVESMVDTGRLDCWHSRGKAYCYIPGTHTPMPTSKTPEKHDRHIAAYLDAFDEFCDEVMERYDQEVIGELTPEAMINLYRGFLTALPDMKKAGGRR